jgi:RNA polymerase sigma factor (sigma-70 family)
MSTVTSPGMPSGHFSGVRDALGSATSEKSGHVTQPERAVRRLRGINQTAAVAGNFEDFVRTNRTRLVAIAYSLCGDRGIAEDLGQEAILATHQAWDGLATPFAYARRTVTNLAASRVRRAGRERRALGRWYGRGDHFAELDPIDAEFWAAVNALPDRQRQVIALHYVDDLPVAAIAEVLEISDGTVKSTLHDARRALSISLSLDPEESP